jgi:hypothetical protein
MCNVCLNHGRRVVQVGVIVFLALLAFNPAVFGQSSTTATIRGLVQDSSGGVLPGANVTLTNAGTKAIVTAVTDDRGQYLFVVFPATYNLKVELSGFKTYEQQGLSVSPNDTRGLDVQLEVGQQTETVTVTAQQEVIQTETGAREGVLTSKQIDNLAIMGRNALELLRIMPGVVTDFNIGESTGASKDVQNYTVNGIRSSGNTAQLDGSNLLDIGCNCGMMVSLNNDMIQEVKVQSSNFAAEYGAGGMNVSGVTKSGTSSFHGQGYYYWRDSKFAANDRSNSIAGVAKPEASYKYPGFNVGGPIFFGDSYTKNKDKLFFFFGYEWQRQQIDSGSRFSRSFTPAMKNGDFSELFANRGSNLNQKPVPLVGFDAKGNLTVITGPDGKPITMAPGQLRIPQGFPGAGGPVPNNDMRPYMTPLGTYLASLYPDSNYTDPNNLYNYVYHALEPEDREEMKMRFDWNVNNNTKAFVRISRDPAEVARPRGGWWAPSEVALPTPNVQKEVGRSYSGNLVSVLSPSMTNEAVVSYTRLTLDNFWQDPSVVAQGAGGVNFQGFSGFPFATGPELPTNILHDGGGQVGHQQSAMPNVFAHNDSLQFTDKLTKLMGSHGLKFGITVERGQKQQDFQNEESGQLHFDPSNLTGTGNTAADMLVGRMSQFNQGTARDGQPLPGMPHGEFRYWDVDAFAQDSWKIKPNFTLEYGVRFGKWTNNVEQSGEGGYFTPDLYDPTKGTFLDPGTFKLLNGVCYVYNDCAPDGVLPNRDAFFLPRINAAWDIDGEGNNVVRGGYGLFYNRAMGNVEYDNTLRMAPNAYNVGVGYKDALAQPIGLPFLSYDNVRQIAMQQRLGSLAINTPTPDSFSWPITHSFSVSYARRVPWQQVVEVAYVGTRGRDLVSRSNGNVMPYGVMSSGTYNGVDLSVPINRVAVASVSDNLKSFRPFNALSGITIYDFRGVSDYNSMQVTLSRQTGRRLQYFVAYTFAKAKGTLGNDYANLDPYDPSRTYGRLNTDRTHILNVSWNAFLPDGARGSLDNAVLRGALNGWQVSGISTLASGIPISLQFTGDAASSAIAAAYFGTADVVGPPPPQGNNGGGNAGNALAPVYPCDPRVGGGGVGERLLDLNCIGVPQFGEKGDLIPPYNLRTPTRMNHDLTLFKNFQIHGEQKFQFRVGFFNLFNQAFASTAIADDINLKLDTVCNVRALAPDGTGKGQNVCDPTQGFSYTKQTIDNFGKINLKRGHRVIEFVFKYYF